MEKSPHASQKSYKKLILILGLTIIALVPQYLIRCNLAICWWFYEKFTTYYGDLWYCWNNYLSQGFPYPREYPSLIQQIFRLIALVPGIQQNYSLYLIFPVVILTICAIITSYYLYKLNAKLSSILTLWIFAPSFLFYGLLNVDFLPIVTIVISYYYFTQQKHTHSIVWLSIGTAIKVFPIFLLPIYFLAAPPKTRLRLVVIFIATWLVLNIPFMISDWGAWSFAYIWQIQSNFARSAQDGSWTWIIFQLFDHFGIGNWSGKVSLGLFALSYLAILYYRRDLSLIRQLMVVIILFLLTDRVYSPQYDLYLLPFLVLVDYRINRGYFYLLEIPNFIQGFFMFFWKNHVVFLQLIIIVKYFALIMILYQLLTQPKTST